jgi:hypothetical protein
MSSMSSQSRTNRASRTLAGVVLLGLLLAGCSDIYFDRRETIALGAEDAVATDRIEQIADPWPRQVGNRNIAFNGEKMQAAAERYRTGRVIPPFNVTTSSVAYQAAEAAAASASSATNQSSMSAPAAPTK